MLGLDTGATYYWFNCNTGAFVDTTMGADTLNWGNEFLQAPDTGYYAAIIVKPGFCSDTSACKYYYVDVPEYETGVSLRPIPASTALQISLDQLSGSIELRGTRYLWEAHCSWNLPKCSIHYRCFQLFLRYVLAATAGWKDP